jgi:hypothetical protein
MEGLQYIAEKDMVQPVLSSYNLFTKVTTTLSTRTGCTNLSRFVTRYQQTLTLPLNLNVPGLIIQKILADQPTLSVSRMGLASWTSQILFDARAATT